MVDHAIIIGAMKSGTSSLYQYLVQHPQICPCSAKEPEFFSDHQDHAVEAKAYEHLWNVIPKQHAWCLEGSTGYTKYPEEPSVPQNMYTYGLQPRFIYILRHPIDRFISDYNYMRQHPYMDAGPLMDRERVARSQYFLQLSRFLDWYPARDRYLLLRFEDLVSEPRAVVNRVFRFLDLSTDVSVDFGVYNKTQQVSVLEQWFRRSGLYRLRDLVPAAFHSRLRRALCMVSGIAHRTLTDAEREALHDALRADVLKLASAFAFDVRPWGFDISELSRTTKEHYDVEAM